MSRLIAIYHVRSDARSIEARAKAIAVEQSVEMPLSAIGDERILKEVVASVEEIRPHAGHFDVVLGIAREPYAGSDVLELCDRIGTEAAHAHA